jgi:hypothetical protein
MEALVTHLVATTGLSEAEVRRVVGDVTAYFSEGAEDFVRRRHAELKSRGGKNRDIFPTIAAELGRRRFAAPPYSERQLRRIVHG